MSLDRLRKQINRANQYVCERIGSAQPTKSSPEFIKLESKTDLTSQVVQQIIVKTKEILQPNPALRVKVAVNPKKKKYPHPEKSLGKSMSKYGSLLGKDSAFGKSLIHMGQTLNQTTEIKYSLEDRVNKEFLEPLAKLQLKDIKECNYQRKKLEGRRLDFDSKKRKIQKGANPSDTDIKASKDKYNQSLKLATVAMQHLLNSDKTQASHLIALSQVFYDYHIQCANVFKSLTEILKNKTIPINESKSAPDLNSVWTSDLNRTSGPLEQNKGKGGLIKSNQHTDEAKSLVTNHTNRLADPLNGTIHLKPNKTQNSSPKCRALYDFEAEKVDELSLKVGDLIELNQKMDENWFSGTLNGKTGYFPISYVEVLVPLKH